eukprot:TRINITY_DN3565_c0_g2_i1.p1 TRINITY_DN3565_c0_g2~~TRINITY_DN3565_c0_g2_i1.p1  ORF type:complete len:521 (+),score=82.87 TRINITY_DN3565_c0_g2_i1:58-1563(+)
MKSEDSENNKPLDFIHNELPEIPSLEKKEQNCHHLREYWKLVQNPGFRLLWIAAIVSRVGDNFNVVACLTLIHSINNDGIVLALYLGIKLVPFVILSPINGVVSDSFNRMHIMMASDIARAVVVLFYLVVVAWNETFLLMFFITFVQIAISSFFEPASGATLPEVVPKKDLAYANSLLQLCSQTVSVLASAMGGLFVSYFGLTACFIFDALSYVASMLLVYRLSKMFDKKDNPSEFLIRESTEDTDSVKNLIDDPIQEDDIKEDKVDLWRAFLDGGKKFVDGYKYLSKHRYIFVVAAIKACCTVAWGAIDLTTVRMSEDEFVIGKSSTSLGILWSCFSIGFGAGPVILDLLGAGKSMKRMHLSFLIMFIIRGGGYFLQSWSPDLGTFILFNVIRTVGEGGTYVYSSALLQQIVPSSVLGRVLSFEMAFRYFVQILSNVSAGILIDTVQLSSRMVILIFSIVHVVSNIWYLIYFLTVDTDSLSQEYSAFQYTKEDNQEPEEM